MRENVHAMNMNHVRGHETARYGNMLLKQKYLKMPKNPRSHVIYCRHVSGRKPSASPMNSAMLDIFIGVAKRVCDVVCVTSTST